MLVEEAITSLVKAEFEPVYLDVVNESHMHSVPPNSETHFKLVLVSAEFEGLNQVKRHQSVYGALREYISNPIHALALHTFSPEEWVENNIVADSPNCMGGSKSG